MPCTVLLLLGCARKSGAAQEIVAEQPPNILFVLADDLGWGDLACYGNDQVHTPQLDALAASGSLFTAFYVASPVCSPSRASFLTGRFPSELGLLKPVNRPKDGRAPTEEESAALPEDMPNLASELSRAGYRTAHFGKWHLGPSGVASSHPLRYGFETARLPIEKDPETGERDASMRSTQAMVDAALAFLDEPDERPFYVQIWLRDPHAPLPLVREGIERYDRYLSEQAQFYGPPAVYMATITDLDTQIGRLLDGLEQRGLSRETIVVFSSDNGPEVVHVPAASTSAAGSPGPFRGMKRSLYEGGIRVPLIVRWPGEVPAGRVEDRSVLSSVDFFPTFLGLAGAPSPQGIELDGEDMLDVLRGASRERRTRLYYEYHFHQNGRDVDISPMLGVREGPWMLLGNPGGGTIELYDVVSDPSQVRDRAADEPERTRRMFELALAWFGSLGLEGVNGPPAGDRWAWPR